MQNSRNSGTLTSSWEKMKIKYDTKPDLLLYLKKTWLVHKKTICGSMDMVLSPLREYYTSRVEGANAAIKRCFEVSTMDLGDVRAKLTHFYSSKRGNFG